MTNKIIILSLTLLLAGCTTLADARLAKGTGAKQIYASSYDNTWDAAVCSLNKNGLSIASENKADKSILAQRGITAFSYGENIAVFIEPVSKKETSVEVVSKKAMQTNIFAPDWSKDILAGVNACMK